MNTLTSLVAEAARGGSGGFGAADHHRRRSAAARWLTVCSFAVAFAWVEAAVVFYLRTMVDRIQPYQAAPLPIATGLAQAELVREAATMLMLLTVGMLAGRTWRTRLGYSAIAFGVWDVFYYVFLNVLCGWPRTLLDWDVLFLLPLPWWGPVLSPVLVALLMIAWGTLAQAADLKPSGPAESGAAWIANGAGIFLALYVFMADSLRVASQGEEALRNLLPVHFNWPLFCLALLLMAAPPAAVGWRLWKTAARVSKN
jgi:hypothetical protein